MKKIGWLLLACLLAPAIAAPETGEPATQLILHARLVDGTGTPARTASVRIAGERIVEVGELLPRPGEVVVDAAGMVLAPGFIDTHSHHDVRLFEMPDALSLVSQGVTTIVVGLDGGSELPLSAYFQKLRSSPVAVNVASYSGHNTLRSHVLGEDYKRPATASELAAMSALLREDLDAGALGLSTGLEYDPGLYSHTDEVVALARVAAAQGGRYASHIRSEDIHLEAAMDEFLAIAREARLPSQISHIKLARRSLWGEAPALIEKLDRARAEGLDITADIYPYTFYESTMRILFSKRDFDNRESAEYALRELVRPEGLTLAHYEPDPTLVGKTIAEIAAAQGRDPALVLMDLIRHDIEHEKTLGKGHESKETAIGVAMSQADVDTLMRWPQANICSDGDLKDGHPRGRGAFARVLADYVRERGVLTLEQAVRKMTSLSAAHVGIAGRGVVAAGAYADLVLFDPAAVRDQATMSDVNRISAGIVKTWVNGKVVYANGKTTGARPGQVLLRSAAVR